MKTISKVVAAIDFSEHSKNVLEYAGGLVANTKGDMVIVNVINSRDIETLQKATTEIKGFTVKGWVERQKKERRQSMQDLIEETNLGQLPIKIVFREGLPFRELLKVIDEEGADLVVMGVKGRSNLREIPIGSTAEKMCQRCPVPILTVRSSRNR